MYGDIVTSRFCYIFWPTIYSSRPSFPTIPLNLQTVSEMLEGEVFQEKPG